MTTYKIADHSKTIEGLSEIIGVLSITKSTTGMSSAEYKFQDAIERLLIVVRDQLSALPPTGEYTKL